MSREELISALNLSHRVNFLKHYLNPALESGLTEMTIPDNPNNRNQKYKVTAKGKKIKKDIYTKPIID